MESRSRNNLSPMWACRENMTLLWWLFVLTKLHAEVKTAEL